MNFKHSKTKVSFFKLLPAFLHFIYKKKYAKVCKNNSIMKSLSFSDNHFIIMLQKSKNQDVFNVFQKLFQKNNKLQLTILNMFWGKQKIH